MQTHHFYKYQGAGNDFILFDNINGNNRLLSKEEIALLCDRRFGIGADGLMYILPEEGFDFRMLYYNADGGESTMCGNGGRCISHLANYLDISSENVDFIAIDGPHSATVSGMQVKLGMNDVTEILINEEDDYVLNTGSPHYIHFCKKEELANVVSMGRSIRYNEKYSETGINVNLSSWDGNHLHVATYERGVEDETLSCGTGVTAAAIALNKKENIASPIQIKTKGGVLKIHFTKEGDTYKNVVLEGPAVLVYEGTIKI